MCAGPLVQFTISSLNESDSSSGVWTKARKKRARQKQAIGKKLHHEVQTTVWSRLNVLSNHNETLNARLADLVHVRSQVEDAERRAYKAEVDKLQAQREKKRWAQQELELNIAVRAALLENEELKREAELKEQEIEFQKQKLAQVTRHLEQAKQDKACAEFRVKEFADHSRVKSLERASEWLRKHPSPPPPLP